MAYAFDDDKGKVNISDVLNTLETNYQNNINSIYNALVNNGVTPTAKTPAAIVAAINGVRSGGTAANTEILNTKTAYVNKSLVTGTMANKGAWTGTGTPTGNNSVNVTVPAGYHNGSGYVTANGATSYTAGVNAQKAVHWTEAFELCGTDSVYIMMDLTNISNWKVTSKTAVQTGFLYGAYFDSSGTQIGALISIDLNTVYTPTTGAAKLQIMFKSATGGTAEGKITGQVTRYAAKLR